MNVPPGDTIAPGDTIMASVSVSSGEWTLSVADTTSPRMWSFTTPLIPWGAAEASAEWIVERPETCTGNQCTLTSLADFGTAAFTSASATPAGGMSESFEALGSTPIEMIRSGTDSTLLAGPPAPVGSGFSDSWDASS